MSTLGMIGLATLAAVVVVAAVVVFVVRRRRASAAEGPRTVADLVRLRAAQAGTATPPDAGDGDPPAPVADGSAEVVGAEVVGAEVDVVPPVRAAGSPVRPSDTPWERAARMAQGWGAPRTPVSIEPDHTARNGWSAPVEVNGDGGGQHPDATPVPAGHVETPVTRAEPAAGPDLAPRPAPSRPSPPAPGRTATVPLYVTPRPAPDGSPQVRRPDAGTVAEQAAADLALLRTFGFTEANGRPETPVSLTGAGRPCCAPVEARCATAPVGFRVVGRDGSGVAGATVTLLDDRGLDASSGTSGADGRGLLPAPPPGSYVLVSTADGRQPGAVAITVADAPTEAEVLLARSAAVSGAVFGADGPVAGVRLTLMQDGEIVETVDSDPAGTYRFGDLAAGAYGLAVAPRDGEPIALLLDVPDETDVRRDIDLDPAGSPADGQRRGSADLVIGHR